MFRITGFMHIKRTQRRGHTSMHLQRIQYGDRYFARYPSA